MTRSKEKHSMSRTWLAVATAGVLALSVSACGSSGNTTTASAAGSSTGSASAAPASLTGSGSTFAAPIYQQIGSELKGQGLTINYQPTGSGQGISDLTNKSVDFAGSDPPMKDEEIAAAKGAGEPVHVPTAFGAITVSYNLDGVKTGMKLDGATIADIYLGKITKWDD